MDAREAKPPAGSSGYGPRRAARLLVALGQSHASEVLARLSDEQIARLAWLVAHTEQLDPGQRDEVLHDFYASLTAADRVSAGGPETVQRMLEAAFGEERASDLQARLGSLGREQPFKFLERVSTPLLGEFLCHEHPQLVALILVNLSAEHASQLLMLLPPDLQVETLVGIVGLDRPAPEAVALTESIVQRRLAGAVESPTEASTLLGAEQLIEVLRCTDVATQHVILQGIADIDAGLAATVRQQLFVFDDLALLDDRSLQRVLREIDQADLTLAIRTANEELRQMIFRNMSSRAATMVLEDMEAAGPVRRSVVHEAQNRIVTVVRRLQDEEEIVINRGGEDTLVA